MRKYSLTIEKKKVDVEVIAFTKDAATLHVNGKKVTVVCDSVQTVPDIAPPSGQAAAPASPKPGKPKAPPPPPRPAKASPTPAPAPSGAADGTLVPAPIPGSVMQIYVKVGDKIKAGTTVVKMEAMKMENEIKAPTEGTVTKICVSSGQNVAQGETLVIIS